ncbi:hypothetical protein ACSNOC_24790, partial [Streptomyces sp. URMC 129]
GLPGVTPPPAPAPPLTAPPPGNPAGGTAPWRGLIPIGSALLIALVVVLATVLPAQGEKGSVAESAATSSPGPTEDTGGGESPAPTPEPSATAPSPEETEAPTPEPTATADPETWGPTDPATTDPPTDPPTEDPCEGITGIRTLAIPSLLYSGESVYTGDVTVTTCTTDEVAVWVEWYAVNQDTGETVVLEEGEVVRLSGALEYAFSRETINDLDGCYTTVLQVEDDADGDPYATAEEPGYCDWPE